MIQVSVVKSSLLLAHLLLLNKLTIQGLQGFMDMDMDILFDDPDDGYEAPNVTDEADQV